MRDYSVEQVVRFEADPEEMEERVDALLGKLESHSAVASYGGTDLAIRLSVESAEPVLPLCVITTRPDHAAQFKLTPR